MPDFRADRAGPGPVRVRRPQQIKSSAPPQYNALPQIPRELDDAKPVIEEREDELLSSPYIVQQHLPQALTASPPRPNSIQNEQHLTESIDRQSLPQQRAVQQPEREHFGNQQRIGGFPQPQKTVVSNIVPVYFISLTFSCYTIDSSSGI